MAKKTLKEAKKMFEGIKKLQVFSPIKQKDDDQNKHWLTDEECLERFGLLLDEIRLEVFFKTGIILDNEKIWLQTKFLDTKTNIIFYGAFVDDPKTHKPFMAINLEVDPRSGRVEIVCGPI